MTWKNLLKVDEPEDLTLDEIEDIFRQSTIPDHLIERVPFPMKQLPEVSSRGEPRDSYTWLSDSVRVYVHPVVLAIAAPGTGEYPVFIHFDVDDDNVQTQVQVVEDAEELKKIIRDYLQPLEEMANVWQEGKE